MRVARGTFEGRGALVARALEGAWRSAPLSLALSPDELSELVPPLVGSGSAGLAWWRLRNTELAQTPAGQALHQAYLTQAAHSVAQELTIERVFFHLREAGIEPVLVKGWGVARLYPNVGVRPQGDIDIYVSEGEVCGVREVLASEGIEQEVDLQFEDLAVLRDRSYRELFERSQVLKLGSTNVRIPGDEDHLAILCVHFLRHGGWRPLWLCDIAAAVECRRDTFDWDTCLGANRRYAGWIASSIGLAARFLGADVQGVPIAAARSDLPTWLVRAVLRAWAEPYASRHEVPIVDPLPLAARLRQPAGLARALMVRWPGPIQATISAGGPVNHVPRLPFQLANVSFRGVRLLGRLRGTVRRG